ncbi:MAG: putative metal-binding motif-containing protein [Sandaracinaceae bacterium]|nr:putative metal-binding motif-containing protein [Sandaracinaceae bacterium]
MPAGYAVIPGDCDDTRAGVNPGAAESCNGLDDNCNGTTDEGVLRTYYRDADMDAYGVASMSTQACSAPSGYTAMAGDCDDASPAVRPGVTDICDEIDNDCDGMVDPGCMCTTGATRSCGISMVGACTLGTQTCGAGAWGACVGNVDPIAEVCNGADDDCDGTVDEGVGAAWYRDCDRDGYGAAGSPGMSGCMAPSTPPSCASGTGAWVSNDDDCDDAVATTYPTAHRALQHRRRRLRRRRRRRRDGLVQRRRPPSEHGQRRVHGRRLRADLLRLGVPRLHGRRRVRDGLERDQLRRVRERLRVGKVHEHGRVRRRRADRAGLSAHLRGARGRRAGPLGRLRGHSGRGPGHHRCRAGVAAALQRRLRRAGHGCGGVLAQHDDADRGRRDHRRGAGRDRAQLPLRAARERRRGLLGHQPRRTARGREHRDQLVDARGRLGADRRRGAERGRRARLRAARDGGGGVLGIELQRTARGRRRHPLDLQRRRGLHVRLRAGSGHGRGARRRHRHRRERAQ